MTTAPSTLRVPSPLPALAHLFARELIRFTRQPSRLIASIGTALLLWAVLGSGFAGSFSAAGQSSPAAGIPGQSADYAAYLIPGMASMVVLFSSIFGAITLIEDRQAGFLQSVLVSPAPAWAVVASKLGAGAILATAQASLVILAAPLVGAHPGATAFPLALAALASIALGVGGLGIAAAWYVDSVQGFHGVMNLLLMPMWLLSGAFFPVGRSAPWLGWVMRLNPLTWPSEALRGALLPGYAHDGPWPWIGAAAFAAAGVALPVLLIARSAGAGAVRGRA